MSVYKNGDIVNGVVTGVENYGVFLKIDSNYTGMIHISEISEDYVSNIKEKYLIGDNIKAIVIDIDYDKKQLKLSIKRLPEDEVCIDKSINGFNLLSENLDSWINEKLNQIENKSSNK